MPVCLFISVFCKSFLSASFLLGTLTNFRIMRVVVVLMLQNAYWGVNVFVGEHIQLVC